MKTFSIVDNTSLLKVDHILIYLEDKWLRISVLQGLGLLAPIHTIWHPNQGTASKMILFDNAYLELCWIEDKEAAQKYALQTGIDILILEQISLHQQRGTRYQKYPNGSNPTTAF